jgi:predicted metal-dependent hydrolase
LRRIVLHVGPGSTPADRERLLYRWYRRRLREVVPPLLEKWQADLGVAPCGWGIKKMRTKWGSCSDRAGRIWLNVELAKKPPGCLEYVVVHELLHLVSRKHDERFLALMDRPLPTWRRRRAELTAAPLAREDWAC